MSEGKITCVVVDDESLAIDLLVGYIQRVPFLKLEQTFSNPFKAWERLNQGGIDLLFLDINMPGLSGLQLAELQSSSKAKVVFTTAYSDYALDGFNLDAVDYLLKPFSFDRFLKAVNKTRPLSLSSQATNVGLDEIDKYLLIKSEHRIIKINFEDIHYIEGFKDYVKIHTDQDKPFLTIKSIRSLEEILPPYFLRIHKSFLISINKIIEIRKFKVKMKNTYIPVSETYRDLFKQTVVDGKI